MKNPLRRRLERLEERPVSPEALSRAFQHYRRTGELPEERRLAEIVSDFVAAYEAACATVPAAPEEDSPEA